MSIATVKEAPAARPAPTTVGLESGRPIDHQREDRRIRFFGMSWKTYQMLIAEIQQPSLRVTFDRGDVEFTVISPRHELLRRLLGRCINIVTEEMNLSVRGFGAATLFSAALERGLEADDWFYLRNEPVVRGLVDLDLKTAPPPDLAVEVEVSTPALPKLPIYAALRVPELWRFDGQRIRVFILQEDGSYVECDRSAAFPWLPLDQVVNFIAAGVNQDESVWARAFRAWLLSNLDDNGTWRA